MDSTCECLELLQFLTKRGYCQLEDIVTNTYGTVLEWGNYKMGVYYIQKHLLPISIKTTKNSDKDENNKETHYSSKIKNSGLL